MTKTGKKLSIDFHKNYNVVYGSMNKYSKSVYLTISSWVTPKDDSELNYNRVIKDLNKKIKQNIYNWVLAQSVNNVMRLQTIVDLDIRVSGVKFNKRSFSNCDITLFFKDELMLNSNEVSYTIDEITKMLIATVFESNKSFKFNKKKR